ncbi:MAG: aromatic aminobenezylarsenical efflux permease ArsG family transporter [Pedobacter sp.]
MHEYGIAIASAFWFGVLTSISPCPLATNIVAISFVGRRVDNPRQVFSAGLLYTSGRSLAYLALGCLLVSSVLSAPFLAHALQKYMNRALGPILILVGLILLGVVSFSFPVTGFGDRLLKRAEAMGVWGAGLLGILFALSFCPTSAALFFGSLLPLALHQKSGLLLPGVYGIATGLPVLFFAVLIALGANRVGMAFNRIQVFERWARRVTGTLFILIGGYYCLATFWGISL